MPEELVEEIKVVMVIETVIGAIVVKNSTGTGTMAEFKTTKMGSKMTHVVIIS